MLGACDSPAASRPQARLERASFLTTNEKRVAAGYGTHEEGETLTGAPGLPIALKYDPNQPRAPRGDPDGGQWTDTGAGGGASRANDDRVISDATPDDFTKPGTRLAQTRQTTRSLTVGGRTYSVSPRQETELLFATQRVQEALRRVRDLDPGWKPLPSLRDPNSVEGALRSYRATAQQAEARATVLERGGVPLGFSSRQLYEEFGSAAKNELRAAGYRDAEPYFAGSAVTGYSYRTGEAFDVGRRSDYDIAIVSPSILQRAKELGIPLRGNGTRTGPIRPQQLQSLGLEAIANRLSRQENRDVGIMIYRTRKELELRGPNLPIP